MLCRPYGDVDCRVCRSYTLWGEYTRFILVDLLRFYEWTFHLVYILFWSRFLGPQSVIGMLRRFMMCVACKEWNQRVTSQRQWFTTLTSERQFTEHHDPGSQCQARDPWPPTQSLTSTRSIYTLTVMWFTTTTPLPLLNKKGHIYIYNINIKGGYSLLWEGVMLSTSM